MTLILSDILRYYGNFWKMYTSPNRTVLKNYKETQNNCPVFAVCTSVCLFAAFISLDLDQKASLLVGI